MVLTFSVAAGLTVAYTLADLFWLHEAFPESVKVGYDPVNKETRISFHGEF